MRALIIEDEINAYKYLKSNIEKLRPQSQIVAHIESVEDAINWLNINEHPDVIFMDIQLSDGLCFEIFEHVEVHCPIIFTTAFNQYAIDAFKVNSIDYLMKPIHKDDLSKAITKLNKQKDAFNSQLASDIKAIFSQFTKQKKNRCLVKKGQHYSFIETDDITFVHSEDGLTFIYTLDKKRYLYNKTVENLMSTLDASSFFQINRGQIVHVSAILSFTSHFNQRLKLKLTSSINDVEIIVSRSKAALFKDWVDT